MSRIGYRLPLYGARHTWPQLDPPKASAQAANEPSPPPATRKASSIEVFRQCLEDGLTSAEDIARKMGVSKGTVSKMAKRAMEEEWLKKQGRQYVLV
jgi:DNA-binding NarL/FixJ family response regulator